MLASSKTFEVDLTGSNLIVAIERLYADDNFLRDTFKIVGVYSDHPLKDESLKFTVKRHLAEGRNFVIFEDPVKMDSQYDSKSIIFYYSLTGNPSEVYLNVEQAGMAVNYGSVDSVSFMDVPRLALGRHVHTQPIPSQVYQIGEFEDFKPAQRKVRQAPKPAVPSYQPVPQPIAKIFPEPVEKKVATSELKPIAKPPKRIPTSKTGEEKWIALVNPEAKRPDIPHDAVLPPPVELIFLKNYDLSHLERDFVVADFERRVNAEHVTDIMSSILKNEFYDNILRGVRLDGGKYGIMDFQHRMHAFRGVRDQFGVKTYDFVLGIYPPQYARQIYRKLNLGKKLTASDILKVIDDGTVPFFNELREWISIYPRADRISAIDMLYAHYYAATGDSYPKFEDAERVLKEIGLGEIERMKEFLKATATAFGMEKTHIPWYRALLFRNIFKIFIEEGTPYKETIEILQDIKRDNKLVEISAGTTHKKRVFENVYQMVREDWRNAASKIKKTHEAPQQSGSNILE